MGDISRNFSSSEFECRCPCKKVRVDPRLLELLELARAITGKPIVIHSGFRCPAHNAAVGGKPNSAHLTGEAADIVCTFSSDRYDLLRTFLTLGATRIGVGAGFIHVDVSQALPQRCLWTYPA